MEKKNNNKNLDKYPVMVAISSQITLFNTEKPSCRCVVPGVLFLERVITPS